VVEDGELGGHYAASTALQALASGLDFGAKVEPPFRVCTWCVQDSGNVVFQYDSSEETDVDVTAELEDVVVLPVIMKS